MKKTDHSSEDGAGPVEQGERVVVLGNLTLVEDKDSVVISDRCKPMGLGRVNRDDKEDGGSADAQE